MKYNNLIIHPIRSPFLLVKLPVGRRVLIFKFILTIIENKYFFFMVNTEFDSKYRFD